MGDPRLAAVLQEAQQQKKLHEEEMERTVASIERLQQEVFSMMNQEADNAQALRQTTVRHKPTTSLPEHDIRGTKTGKELVQIWRRRMKANKQVSDQLTSWYSVGPGSQIKFGDKLDENELNDLKVLCFAFKDIFSINPKAPPEAKGIEHALYFKSDSPRPHRRPIPQLSQQEMSCMDKELSAMLANHIIQYSDSEWATLPVFAKKKDNTLRVAIDYRMLNSQVYGDNQSIPNIGEVLDSLTEAEMFSCYDCSAGFWGLKLREQDRKYTGFHGYHNGAWNLFEFKRMPMGLKSATATYQRMQQRIKGSQVLPQDCDCRKNCTVCSGQDATCEKCKAGCDQCVALHNRIVKVFVDDGCCYSTRKQDHVDDLKKVFTRLAANHIALKPVKCLFGTQEIVLLGHEVVAKIGIRPEREKVKAILEMTLPQTCDALHGFVGATSWVSKHIPEYAALVKPLRDIVHSYDKKSKASIAHEWSKSMVGEVAVRAFETLKLSLASRPCLALPGFNKPFIIVSDASKVALGACLCQMDDEGELRPIAYASTLVKDCDKEKHITLLEGKALTFAVKKWRHMIYATTCICITDHIALKSLASPTKEFDTEAMARMALTLSEYDLVIAHRPGTSKELIISDMMSRAATGQDVAKLESLMEQAWGCIGTLCTDTRLHLSQQALSGKNQVRRLQHLVDGSTIQEMVKGKLCVSVQDMVRAIESGDRPPKPVIAQCDEEPSRIEEMYDMITTLTSSSQAEVVTDEDVLAAQLLDPFCKQMRAVLKGKNTRIKGDKLYQACKWQAPHHLVTEDGLVRRLLWTKGKQREIQLTQGRAPAVVPEAAKGLQSALCHMPHLFRGAH